MSLSLKITVSGATKTMQLTGDMSIHEVCKQIKEKFEVSGGSDLGLFFPAEGKWLASSKVLDFYDFKSGDTLEYKKKHRPLKFRMLDGSIKTVIVDETLPIQQLVTVVCERIGIQNAEEYSFQPDTETVKVTTGKKSKKNKNVQSQIADDARWLNPDRTLAEQGLGEADLVILKKKFYYTDQNIDRNDPVQLNLLYNQAKQSILSGKHPCTSEEASQFAAIQCQVQFGNHEPDKHKPGFIKVKEFLPPEYHKNKDVEKKTYIEHRKLQGLSDLNAKFRYVQLSRSLKTYGITFFLVNEKVGKRNKLVPMLIGVTKNSVVRLDIETKDIIKEWKLTQLRRWAASPNSFTLDFGDYSDAYFNVQTTEGEQISQLIAGYIDIILKKRKEAEKVVPEEEVEESTVEEYIKPGIATNVVGIVSNGYRIASETKGQLSPNLPNGMNGTNQYPGTMGQFFNPQPSQPEYNALQQALLNAIKNGLAVVKNAITDLNVATQLPPLGDDPVSLAWKSQTIEVNSSNIASELACQLSAAASLLNHANGNVDLMDFDTLCANVASLTSNVNQISQGIKLLAALSDEEGYSTLETARSLAQALSDLLSSIIPLALGEVNKKNDLYGAGQNFSVAAYNLLLKLGALEISEDMEQDLLASANALSKLVGEMVGNARLVSKSVPNEEAQQHIVLDAKFTYENCQQLLACVNMVLPALHTQGCIDQIMEGSVLLRDAVGMLANSCSVGTDPKLVEALIETSQRVENHIAILVDKASKAGITPGQEGDEIDQQYEQLLFCFDKMTSCFGNAESIIITAKELTLTATHFVSSLKKLATTKGDGEEKNRLLNGARNLAEMTSKMVKSAKDAARFPNDSEKQNHLKVTIEEMKKAANLAAPNAKDRSLVKLAKVVKAYIASSNQLISSAKSSASSNRNQASQLQLNQSARNINEIIPVLIPALKTFQNFQKDLVSQISLINAAKEAIQPGNSFIISSKAAIPTIGDGAAQSQLSASTLKNEEDLKSLEKAVKLADELKSDENQIDNALDSIKNIQRDLALVRHTPNQLGINSPESAQAELFSVAFSIQNTITDLVNSANQGDSKQMAQMATDAVMALNALSLATQGYIASGADGDLSASMLDAASGVADTLSSLIMGVKVSDVDREKQEENFNALALNVSSGLEMVVGCLPGRKELDRSIAIITEVVSDLTENVFNIRNDDKGTKESRIQDLQNAASEFTQCSNNLVTAAVGTSTDELKSSVAYFESSFLAMTKCVFSLGSLSPKVEENDQLMHAIQNLGEKSIKLLQSTKTFTADKKNDTSHDELVSTISDINSSLEFLLGLAEIPCVGVAECNQALQAIALAHSKLDKQSEGEFLTYSECIKLFSAKTKSLMMCVGTLGTLARAKDKPRIAAKITEIASALSYIGNAVIRASFLVGLSDVNSTAAIECILSYDALTQSSKGIKEACKSLLNPDNSQSDVLILAGVVAKETSNICAQCKTAGQNPLISASSRPFFVTTAKSLAAKTSILVNSIKILAASLDENSRNQCLMNSSPLLENIDVLLEFAGSGEFTGKKAKISPAGILLSEPLKEKTRILLSSFGKDSTNLQTYLF